MKTSRGLGRWAAGFAVLGALAGSLAWALGSLAAEEEAQVWETYRHEVQIGVLRDAASRLSFFFKNTYETARTVSLLPGVRSVKGTNRKDADEDVVAEGRLGLESDTVIKNLYLNLVSNFTISEIYCILDGLDPQAGQVPFFMYDSVVVGLSTGDSSQDPSDVPEADESEEYAWFPGALASLKAAHPEGEFASLADIPVIYSPPMVTCDNTQYLSVAQGDKDHTRGLAALVPLLDQGGKFRGAIAVIYRLDTLRALLLGIPFLPITDQDKAKAKTQGFDWPAKVSSLVVHLPGPGVDLTDPRAPDLVRQAQAARDASSPDLLTQDLAVPGMEGAAVSYWLSPAEKDAVLAPGRRVLATEWTAVALAFLLGTAVWTVVWRAGRRQERLVANLTDAVHAVGQGDLTVTLEVGRRVRGSMAALGQAFVAMVSSIRQVVGVLDESIESSSQVSSDLASSSVEASATLQTIAGSLARIGEVVVALEGLVTETMEANFHHAQAESLVRNQVTLLVERLAKTAAYVESSLTSFQAASSTMQKQSGRLAEFRHGSREARERIDTSSAQLGRVEAEAARIAEAVGLIADITAKTKLLAMNAAIEAAHAGAQGRGFGVVSQNIRALAEETEARNSSIASVLNNLQTALTGAREAQDWTRNHLASLLSDFESLGVDLTAVSDNMQDLGHGSEEVLGDLTQTRDGSLQVVKALEVMTVESEKLVTKIGELVDLAQTTTVETRSVEGAIGGVQEVVELVSHAGSVNLEGVERLQEHLARFKT